MKKVAAAVIRDKAGKILICRRRMPDENDSVWEFPGGKLEEGETADECARRECREELGVSVKLCGLFCRTEYSYPDGDVELYFFSAVLKEGTPQQKVHQEFLWVSPEQLSQYSFWPANREVLYRLSHS